MRRLRPVRSAPKRHRLLSRWPHPHWHPQPPPLRMHRPAPFVLPPASPASFILTVSRKSISPWPALDWTSRVRVLRRGLSIVGPLRIACLDAMPVAAAVANSSRSTIPIDAATAVTTRIRMGGQRTCGSSRHDAYSSRHPRSGEPRPDATLTARVVGARASTTADNRALHTHPSAHTSQQDLS